jgi:hypothetical protein
VGSERCGMIRKILMKEGKSFTSARSTNLKPTAAPPHFHKESSKLSALTTNVSPNNTVFCPTVLLLSRSDHEPLCLWLLSLSCYRTVVYQIPSGNQKDQRRTGEFLLEFQQMANLHVGPSTLSFALACSVMAAVKDGALNQGAEDGLRVGDAASGSVEEVARYIFRDVAASYVRNLTIPGS